MKSYQWLKKIEYILLALAFTLGVLVIAGWLLNIPTLIQIMPSFVPMQFNTAFFLITTAIGIFAADHFRQKKLSFNPVQYLAIFNILMTSIILLQYFIAHNFGLDEFFIRHYIFTKTSHAGRMSPQSAICYIAINIGLFLYTLPYQKKKVNAIRLISLSVFALATLALSGYIFNIEAAYTIRKNSTQMAAHTAVGFILLSLALKAKSIRILNEIHSFKNYIVHIILLSVAIVIEVVTPPGISVAPAFAPAIIFAVYYQQKSNIFILTSVSFLTICLDYYISLNTDNSIVRDTTNLGLSLISLGLISFLAFTIQNTINKLKDQKKFNDNIVNNTVEAIITINDIGEITSLNKAAEIMFGYQKDELTGKNIKIIIQEGIKEEHETYSKNDKTNSDKKSIGKIKTLQARHKDNGIIDIELSVSEMNINNKLYYTGIVRDITERKKSDAEIARSHHELERFAYVASHDLQEPLRKLKMFSDLLLASKDNNPEKIKQYVTSIHTNADKMSRLIKDILDYSKIDYTTYTNQVTDLNEIMNHITENLSVSIQQTNAQIKYNILPVIEASQILILQLLQNIISNAIKYHRPGVAPIIELEVQGSINEWQFCVKDNGIGIDEQNIELIFQPFKRLHAANTQGSGLGLSISKKIVDQLHGKIRVESTVGAGSSFYWTVPKYQSKT